MKKALLTLAALIAVSSGLSARVDTTDTRLLSQPAISASHVAFVYAGDLWSARVDGTDVRRLTSDEGVESYPAFSPDGSVIAFSAQYEGNTDVYTVPVRRGPADSPHLASRRGHRPELHAGREGGAVRVGARGLHDSLLASCSPCRSAAGWPRRCRFPTRTPPTYSPDGKRMAYNPLGPRFEQWKWYRGGTASTITLYTTVTHASEKIPQPAERANDADPMWLGDQVYFRSDRNGEFNIFSYNTKTRDIRQLTKHADFPVLSARAGSGQDRLRAGRLPARARSGDRDVAQADARGRVRPASRLARGSPGADAGSATRDVVAIGCARGLRVPRRDRHGAGGEGRRPQSDRHDRRSRAQPGLVAGRHEARLLFRRSRRVPARTSARRTARRRRRSSRSRDTASTESGLVARQPEAVLHRQLAEHLLGRCQVGQVGARRRAARPTRPCSQLRHVWSPDSKWIAYTIGTRPLVMAVSAFSIDQGKSFPITDGLAEVTEPVFDRERQVPLLLRLDRRGSAARLVLDVERRHARRRATSISSCCGRTCRRRWRKESDEEKGRAQPGAEARREDSAAAEAGRARAGIASSAARRGTPATEQKPAATPPVPFSIDFDDIQYRILDMPIPAGEHLQPAGRHRRAAVLPAQRATASPRCSASISRSARADPLVDATDYVVSADGKKLLYAQGDTWFIVVHAGADRAATREDSRPTRSRCGSIRAPSGSRSSTRRGASTATTSTTRTCTASTGGAKRDKYAQSCSITSATRERPQSRDAVDVERAVRRASQRRRRRLAGASRARCRAACSAPTTRWRTAATASRRSTAG